MQPLKNVRWKVNLQHFGRKLRVALDDGHGINTPGKRTPDGYNENRFNSPVVKKLAKLLKDDGRFEVYEVADGDSDVPLTTRTNRANSWGADIYISVHYNAMGFTWSNHIGGIETFSYPGSSTGKKIAACLHKQLIKGTKLYDRGLKTADFHVLRETRMPAALVECGFMDVKREADLMKSDAYRQECANELYLGTCDYFNLSPKKVVGGATEADSGYLDEDDRGKDVEELQQLLKWLGFDPGAVDGIFGPNTTKAVKAFQKAKGLSQDGIVGPNTFKKLDEAKKAKEKAEAEAKKKAEEEKKRKEEEARKKAEEAKKAKEEEKVIEKAIVINGEADYSAAVILSMRLKAPIYTGVKYVDSDIHIKTLYAVGTDGKAVKAKVDKIVPLMGDDRYDTAQKVDQYLDKL